MTTSSQFCLSIVSHGQGRLIELLLSDLLALDVLTVHDEIILTLNLPEDESFLDRFSALPIRVLRNAQPKGFGANHNGAFAVSNASVFVVVNPDIRLRQFDRERIIDILSHPYAGMWAPKVVSGTGVREDSARRFPTVLRLARRVLLRQRQEDYSSTLEPITVDWVAGMFMAIRRETYAELGGFDERYFMYMEDADICRRIGDLKKQVIFDPSMDVVHDARRASRRDWRHLRWHCRSAARFLLGI